MFAGNYTLIDWELHDLWISGFSVSEAAAHLRSEENKKTLLQDFPDGVPYDLLVADLNDNYRYENLTKNIFHLVKTDYLF